MAQPIVLVTFACQSGDIEKLALSAAVGAVQARAMIRLRRLPDNDASATSETLTRMRKEYVGPSEGDVLGADALILAADSGTSEHAPQWQEFLTLLRKLGREGRLSGKVGATIGGFTPNLKALGFITLEPSSDALTLGRSVAERARTLKSS